VVEVVLLDAGNKLQVEIAEPAKEYILSKGDSVTVVVGRAFGGCDNACDPVVFAGKPHFPESYYEFLVDGIKVYVFKGVYAEPEGIKISLASIRGLPILQVAGVITY